MIAAKWVQANKQKTGPVTKEFLDDVDQKPVNTRIAAQEMFGVSEYNKLPRGQASSNYGGRAPQIVAPTRHAAADMFGVSTNKVPAGRPEKNAGQRRPLLKNPTRTTAQANKQSPPGVTGQRRPLSNHPVRQEAQEMFAVSERKVKEATTLLS